MEKYPRGRRGSPAKGVGRVERRPGSNPGFSAIDGSRRSKICGSHFVISSVFAAFAPYLLLVCRACSVSPPCLPCLLSIPSAFAVLAQYPLRVCRTCSVSPPCLPYLLSIPSVFAVFAQSSGPDSACNSVRASCRVFCPGMLAFALWRRASIVRTMLHSPRIPQRSRSQ